MRRLSGLNDAAFTPAPRWSLSPIGRPSKALEILTVWSAEAVSSRTPSAANAADTTSSCGISASCWPFRASHRRAPLPYAVTARNRPAELNADHRAVVLSTWVAPRNGGSGLAVPSRDAVAIR